jgi:erythritol transport system ATP-binding protein
MSTSLPYQAPDVVLESRGLSKRYGAHLALKEVTFRVRRGCVNVLIGENGAGKSTLMRLLSGAEQPDGGEILLEGAAIHLPSPRDATKLGIAIVHQELAIFGNLDLADNIFAGRELVRSSGILDRGAEERSSLAALRHLNKPMNVRLPADALSLGDRQVVELARSFADGSRVLILDEPTSALSASEATVLFRVIEDLKSRGVSIVYISHRLHELLHLGDHFTVLRDGEVVGETDRSAVDRHWIIERMSGRVDQGERSTAQASRRPPVLEIAGLSLSDGAGTELNDVSLELCPGTVVGIYGLLGSGRTELLETVAGLRFPSAGEVRVGGKSVPPGSVSAAIERGIMLVPEDRQGAGILPELSVRENISLASMGSFSRGGLLQRKLESSRAKELIAQLRIAVHDLELPVTALSGGNQQKVVLARCLMRHPAVLLLDEPTRGVDVRAKAEIYRILRELAVGGLCILFTSSEMEEIRALADEVLVVARGRVTARFAATEITDADLFAAASPTVEPQA